MTSGGSLPEHTARLREALEAAVGSDRRGQSLPAERRLVILEAMERDFPCWGWQETIRRLWPMQAPPITASSERASTPEDDYPPGLEWF